MSFTFEWKKSVESKEFGARDEIKEAAHESKVRRTMDQAQASAHDFYASPEYQDLPPEIMKQLELKGVFNVFLMSRVSQDWRRTEHGVKPWQRRPFSGKDIKKQQLAEGDYFTHYTDFEEFQGETNKVFEGATYVTDIPNEVDVLLLDRRAEKKDHVDRSVEMRELLTSAEVVDNLDFASAEMLEYCENDEETKAVGELTQEYRNFVIGKEKVFSRRGPRSAYDILSDYYLTAKITEEKAARETLQYLDGEVIAESADKDNGSSVEQLKKRLDECRDENEREKLFDVYTHKVVGVWQQSTRLMEVCQKALNGNSYQNITKLEEEALPSELRSIQGEYPDISNLLKELAAGEQDVLFVSRERTDPKTLAAIHEIGKDTQNRYQTNWLPELVKNGKKPKIQFDLAHERRLAIIRKEIVADELKLARLREERERYKFEGQQEEADQASEKILNLDLKLAEAKDEAGLEDNNQGRLEALQVGADRIAANSDRYKRVAVVNPEKLDDKQKEALAKLNSYLEATAREFAAEKMQWDISNHQTAEGVNALKKLFMAGPTAEMVETALPAIFGESGAWHYAGKIIAGLIDDIVGEYGEWKCMAGQGFTAREIFGKRAVSLTISTGLASSLLLASEYVGRQSEHATSATKAAWYRAAGGATFGLGATLVSQTTAVQTMFILDKARKILLAEGKLTAMDFLEESETLKKVIDWKKIKEGGDLSQDQLLAEIKRAFSQLSEQDAQRQPEMLLTPEEIERLRETVKALSKEEIEKIVNTKPDEEEVAKFSAAAPGQRDALKFLAYSAKFKETWDEIYRLPIQKIVKRKVKSSQEGAETIFSSLGDMKFRDLSSSAMPYTKEEQENILEDLKRFDVKSLTKMIEASPERARFFKAVEQDFNHPARLGVFLGAIAAMVGGAASWAAGYKNVGTLNAALGTLETTGGVAAAVFSKAKFDYSWQHKMESRAKKNIH